MNGKIIAKILEFLDFSEAVHIINQIPNGDNTVLPYMKEIHSDKAIIPIHKLNRCLRARKISFPNTDMITTNTLLKMPLLRSITIKSRSNIDWFIFEYLQYLSVLQILGNDTCIVDAKALQCMDKLEYLHISNDIISEDNLKILINLKVLVLVRTNITPAIINFLPKLEVLIINGILYKYRHTLRNIGIIQRIGHLSGIYICNIQ